jgi:hypothetical protein
MARSDDEDRTIFIPRSAASAIGIDYKSISVSALVCLDRRIDPPVPARVSHYRLCSPFTPVDY